MSTYYTIEAELTYTDKTALEKAIKPLREGGWINESNEIICEDNEVICHNIINGSTLTIPHSFYRNLGRVTQRSSGFFDGVESGEIIIICEDGCMQADVYRFRNGETVEHVETDGDELEGDFKGELTRLGVDYLQVATVDEKAFTLEPEEFVKEGYGSEDEYWEIRSLFFNSLVEEL
jgi:hypothetical protein